MVPSGYNFVNPTVDASLFTLNDEECRKNLMEVSNLVDSTGKIEIQSTGWDELKNWLLDIDHGTSDEKRPTEENVLRAFVRT
jgi:hypothetical protein